MEWQAIEAKKLGPVLDERRAQFLNWPPTLVFRCSERPVRFRKFCSAY